MFGQGDHRPPGSGNRSRGRDRCEAADGARWPVRRRRSRGGWTTKIHALTDVIGRPCALTLTAGNGSDVKAAPALIERAGRMRYLLADKGYDADRLRRSLRETGTTPVIPGRRNRKCPIRYDQQRYRARHLIENAFCRLKDFRRVAARYHKPAANFHSTSRTGDGTRILALIESEL